MNKFDKMVIISFQAHLSDGTTSYYQQVTKGQGELCYDDLLELRIRAKEEILVDARKKYNQGYDGLEVTVLILINSLILPLDETEEEE